MIGVIYGSTSLSGTNGSACLDKAVRLLLDAAPDRDSTNTLWSLHYQQSGHDPAVETKSNVPSLTRDGNVFTFPVPSLDIAFDDSLIDMVRMVWDAITEDDPDRGTFLQFTDREAEAAAALSESDGENSYE